MPKEQASGKPTSRRYSSEEKAAAVQAFAKEVVPMLADGRLEPTIDSVYDAGDIHAAFDRLAERGKRGKVLVRFP